MSPRVAERLDRIGRSAVDAVSEFGLGATLLLQSVKWIIVGRHQAQPVRVQATFARCMEVGIEAIPIITLMSLTIGMMLAIQAIYTLRVFGAEDQVVIGVAMAVPREFAPIFTGILVAGRTGSSLAARIGTMRMNQEIDALQVMGINPVRFVVTPALIAMAIMVPALTFWSGIVMLTGAGWYIGIDLDMSWAAYIERLRELVKAGDVWHGINKSFLFGILITLVGCINGALVTGGAEGVGKMTTRSVVLSICAIIVTDMIFAFIATRS